MRKLICYLIVFMTLPLVSHAQSYKEMVTEENKKLSFGFHFGAVGQAQDLGLQIILGSMTFYGVYVDFGGWPQGHGSDVRVDKWDADRAFVFHAGYQVPIARWLKIIPMIGYASDESGYTDGSDWRVTNNGIQNKFHANEKVKGFDYGCQLRFSVPVGQKTDLNIMGTYTKYCWYGGLGLGLRI